jgi:hypothetical protein
MATGGHRLGLIVVVMPVPDNDTVSGLPLDVTWRRSR